MMATNMELAGKVARHVRLNSISLRSAHVESKFDPDGPPSAMEFDQMYRANLESVNYESTGRVVIVVDFKFMARNFDGEEPSDAVTLDAAYSLIYELDSSTDIDERCFKYFAEVNGPYNAWPYWRELVQSVTGRVGLAGVTVPVYHPKPERVGDNDLADCDPEAS